MLGSQHVFSHQQPFSEWAQPQHHQSAHHNSQPQHMNQQHYNRLPANSNASTTASLGGITSSDHVTSLANATEQTASEEQRRMLEWIAQLLSPATRETALLDLSKKREQVSELALILWHSFGTCYTHISQSPRISRLTQAQAS